MTTESHCTAEHLRTFFTIGYAGRSLDALIDALSAKGITSLIDIRHFPGSRFRPEVSKRNLEAALSDVAIEYAHNRDLGIPPHVRRDHGFPEHTDALWTWYDEHVIEARLEDLSWLDSFDEGPIAMMCVEQDPQACHRHRLAAALVERGIPYGGEL